MGNEFKSAENLMENLILLNLAKNNINDVDTLIRKVETSNFSVLGFSASYSEIKARIFDFILNDYILFSKKEHANSKVKRTNEFSITKVGLIFLENYLVFKEIAENFPPKKEGEKKKK